MKRTILTLCICAASVASLSAQRDVNDKMSTDNLSDSKTHYRHLAPSIAHLDPTQIKSRESIDILLSDLYSVADSGAEYIIGSHGAPATQKEVKFQIEYLERMKALLSKCKDSDSFTQHLITAYPTINGAESVAKVAKALYPNEQVDAVKEQVRARVQEYFDMVSNIDEQIAKDLWAQSGNISIITPRSQFVGIDAIMNDFLVKSFSSMKSRKLQSLNEVINIYGDSANVQLYWIFDTVDAKGEAHQTRGRESLIFAKINDEWRLVHVHYSRMPQ